LIWSHDPYVHMYVAKRRRYHLTTHHLLIYLLLTVHFFFINNCRSLEEDHELSVHEFTCFGPQWAKTFDLLYVASKIYLELTRIDFIKTFRTKPN
jgi:hypothetical protein